MCHAKTTKGSQLSLDAIEEVLSPFFKPAAAPAAASPEAAAAAAAIKGATAQPPDRQNDQYLHHEAMSDPGGGSDPKGGAPGPADQAEEAVDPCSKKAAAGPNITPEGVTRDEVADEMPQPPERHGKRPTKKIRFTGALGQFLDGGGVWNDFAVMEAERKAELNLQQQQLLQPEQEQQREQVEKQQQQQQDRRGQVGDDNQERREEEAGKEEEEEEEVAEKEQQLQEGKGGGGAGGKNGEGEATGSAPEDGGWKKPTALVDPDLEASSPVSSDPPATSAGTGRGSSRPADR